MGKLIRVFLTAVNMLETFTNATAAVIGSREC
jgi:hypothetical protein